MCLFYLSERMHRHIQMFVILCKDTNVRMSIHRVRNKQCLQKCAKKICSPWTDWEMVFFFKKKQLQRKNIWKKILLYHSQIFKTKGNIAERYWSKFGRYVQSIQLFQRWKQRSNIYILKNLGSITRAATNCARRKNTNSL